ncbi:hypothetical protein K438DRAFT_1983392 [Mycena galopus ATCC 62051]|nr:hypothetical protein K438DRAFT_1983392 [Mycena galopus ATCC 62051]
MAQTRRISKSAATASAPPSAPPFRFRGKRLKFLEGYNDAFDTVCDEGRWRSFWREVTQAYWLVFPWHLSMDLDPHCSMDLPNHRSSAQRIKRYFFHQRHVCRRRATLLANAIASGAAGPAAVASAAEAVTVPDTAAPATAGAAGPAAIAGAAEAATASDTAAPTTAPDAATAPANV